MKKIALVSIALFLAAAASVFADQPGVDPDKDYDRLDGRGTSGKRVDVIEWEGNLEVHVYPKGSLKGLALKLDDRNENKPVMIIGFRFDGAPQKQLIRRAILGVPFREGSYRAYVDPSGDEYDKVIVSMNQLASLAEMKLDPKPTQLYPEGDPRNMVAAAPKKEERRIPAAVAKSAAQDIAPAQAKGPDAEGNVGHFDFK